MLGDLLNEKENLERLILYRLKTAQYDRLIELNNHYSSLIRLLNFEDYKDKIYGLN
jgi:hypothetical protein